MGNAYDYMYPRLIVCGEDGCREATSREIKEIIEEILEEMSRK